MREEMVMLRWLVPGIAALFASSAASAQGGVPGSDNQQACGIPSATIASVQSTLAQVVQMPNGGLFSPNLMWSAVVDRTGRLCSVIKTGDA
jgi:hypothetical protein